MEGNETLFFDKTPQGEHEEKRKEKPIAVPFDHDPPGNAYKFPDFTFDFMRKAQKSLSYITGQPSTDALQIGNEKIEGGISKNKKRYKIGKRRYLKVPNKIALIKAVRDLVFRNIRGLVITSGEYAFKKRDVQPFFKLIFTTGRSIASRFVQAKEKVYLLDSIIERMLTVTEKKAHVLQGSPIWCLTTAHGYLCKMTTKNKDLLSFPYISKALLEMPINPDSDSTKL